MEKKENTISEPISVKENARKSIYSITPFTLLDYPHKTACILWFAGCNMRCLYCYNPEIVWGKGRISFDETIHFLKTREHLLDAVVFSGGECVIHKNIVPLIKKVKEMGFLVKIDTNGSSPEVLKQLLNENLIDYIALDYKAPKSKFIDITQSNLYDDFEKTLDLLLKYKIEFEVRTTYHSELLSEEDLSEMLAFLDSKNYKGNYYIQYFKNNINTIGKLEYSVNSIAHEKLSTTSIKVIIRE